MDERPITDHDFEPCDEHGKDCAPDCHLRCKSWEGDGVSEWQCGAPPERHRKPTESDRTLALIAEHRLIVMPSSADSTWYAGTDDLGEWGPTIGEAVRACVARIRS